MLPTLATPKLPSPMSCFSGSMNIPKEYPTPSRVKVVRKQARTTSHPQPPSGWSGVVEDWSVSDEDSRCCLSSSSDSLLSRSLSILCENSTHNRVYNNLRTLDSATLDQRSQFTAGHGQHCRNFVRFPAPRHIFWWGEEGGGSVYFRWNWSDSADFSSPGSCSF